MRVNVSVTNAEWVEGCADTDDHDHPNEFDAAVHISDDIDTSDQLVMDAAIHDALIKECNCCIIECDIDVESVHTFMGRFDD